MILDLSCLSRRKTGVRILFLDTEVAPSLGYFYGRYDIRIGPDQIVHNNFFMSYQAAWNDGEVFTGSLKGKKNCTDKDDKKLVQEMVELINKADVVIAHNADRFDLALLSARLAAHRLKPFHTPQVIDTLKVCKRFFKFESNSLDSVCQELGIGRKFHSGGFETSLAAIKGDKKAWNKLLNYGKHDVVLLRELYLRLRPWMKNHPNMGLYTPIKQSVCVTCQSTNLHWHGYVRTKTQEYHRAVCQDCGAVMRERTTALEKAKRIFITVGS